jgi:hypothetical protein
MLAINASGFQIQMRQNKSGCFRKESPDPIDLLLVYIRNTSSTSRGRSGTKVTFSCNGKLSPEDEVHNISKLLSVPGFTPPNVPTAKHSAKQR